MLIFTNPGLIDLEAVRTLGVSVKQPGSFGRFGTGLKFAIATILRGGGSVTLYRGFDRHQFSTVERRIRDQAFQIVTLDDQPLGITTQLGRDWEPWMVLRELGCNALDEGGEFSQVLADDEATAASLVLDNLDPFYLAADQTTLIVTWPDLDLAYQQRDELFLPASQPILLETARLHILAGPSTHLFYRGIRVYKLERPSLLTYDLLAEQHLTEDRTLGSSYIADSIIRDTLLAANDRELIRQVLTSGSGYHESQIDYETYSWNQQPSRAWIDAAIETREQDKLSNATARKVLLKHMRSATEEESAVGGNYRRAVEDSFQYALDLLAELGMAFDPAQQFIKVSELPEARMLSMLESGRVYYLEALTSQPARAVAEELLLRWAELHVQGYDMAAMAKLLAPFVLGRSQTLQLDEQLIAEDAELERLAEEHAAWEQDRAAVAAGIDAAMRGGAGANLGHGLVGTAGGMSESESEG